MEYSFTLTYLLNNEIKTISSEKFSFENDELLLKGINDHSLKNSKYSFTIFKWLPKLDRNKRILSK